jgi:hypothetical protein
MSTFTPPADIAQITLAKSSDVNAVKAATAIAFGLLPSETKLQRGTVNFAVDTGTVNSYVVALDASITSYTDGLQVVFRPLNDNTGSATINLNSLGAKSIRLTDSEPIQAGDISAGGIIEVRYSTATGFFHLTPNSAIYAHDAGVSATAAAASASTASIQATNAASSASSASTSASSASTSATNASDSASTASTQATNASTSATNAASSATAASGSASTATTQAGIATTQATNASTSASTATTQASNASTSASNAASSATAAAASYDSFDDRYLGAKASDPSVDNDGNALLTGALYWNATSSEMRVYSGSAWAAVYIPAAGYLALSGGTMTGAITFAAGQFGTNVNTFLTTPTSANLKAALTDETGSGAAVFSTSPTLVTPVLGTPASGNLSSCTVDGTDAVGFRNIPINSQSAAYTAVLADSGKCIFHPSTDANARTFTIPANSSVAYPIGTAISFVNMTSQVVSIAITTDTMYLAGTGTTGTRSLAQYGTATALKMTSTTWIISGAGLT